MAWFRSWTAWRLEASWVVVMGGIILHAPRDRGSGGSHGRLASPPPFDVCFSRDASRGLLLDGVRTPRGVPLVFGRPRRSRWRLHEVGGCSRPLGGGHRPP